METFERSTWRLIIDEAPRSGAANMALDQAMAEAGVTGESLPTVRFYRWHPPAVTLGRHQKIRDINLTAVKERGYDVVRRPTGGRAILHIDELTYSVAAPMHEPRVAGNVMDAYLRLSHALVAGLEILGLRAGQADARKRAGRNASAACFEIPSAYEITVRGRKLIGSAQSRRVGYVLQHGSLPLTGDITRLIDVLALSQEEAAVLRTELMLRAGTLMQALNSQKNAKAVQFTQAAQALARGFGQVLNIELKSGTPTAAEIRRSAELIRTHFGNAEWTQNR